jgi:hypothetical protein
MLVLFKTNIIKNLEFVLKYLLTNLKTIEILTSLTCKEVTLSN